MWMDRNNQLTTDCLTTFSEIELCDQCVFIIGIIVTLHKRIFNNPLAQVILVKPLLSSINNSHNHLISLQFDLQ